MQRSVTALEWGMCSYIETMVLVLLSCITLMVVMGAVGLTCYVYSNWKDICNEISGIK